MRPRRLTSIAAIGASTLTVVGAVVVMILQGSPETGALAGDMSTGTTVTGGAAATVISVTKAAPTITGPAPLPSEEQGLPG